MKKNISRNPLWPDWYNGKKIDEVQFGRAFLEQWPLKCVNGTLYTLDGPVEDESEIKQRILENLSKKKKSVNKSGYPDDAIKSLARCFYPSMVEFFNSEEGQREYEEWLKEQEALQALPVAA